MRNIHRLRVPVPVVAASVYRKPPRHNKRQPPPTFHFRPTPGFSTLLLLVVTWSLAQWKHHEAVTLAFLCGTATSISAYFWARQFLEASGSAALVALVIWMLLFFCVVTTAVARNLPEIQENCAKFIPATIQRACPAAATNDAAEAE